MTLPAIYVETVMELHKTLNIGLTFMPPGVHPPCSAPQGAGNTEADAHPEPHPQLCPSTAPQHGGLGGSTCVHPVFLDGRNMQRARKCSRP